MHLCRFSHAVARATSAYGCVCEYMLECIHVFKNHMLMGLCAGDVLSCRYLAGLQHQNTNRYKCISAKSTAHKVVTNSIENK